MKKIFLLNLILFTCLLQAQFRESMFKKNPIVNLENFDMQRVYWGYFLGFSSYDFKIDYKNSGQEIAVNSTTGFNVGIVGDLRLSEYFNLRAEPGLYITQRDLNYPGFVDKRDIVREVKATNIHFPFLLKYSALRTGNVRPFLVTGVSATLNLGSNETVTDDNQQQVFRVSRWTQNYELGFGIDFYTEYFKFSPSVRGVFGLNDELVRDRDPNSPWTSNIESLKTRGVFVNFTFH
jgi:Outer membrane protein beta-barrel domain